MLKSHEIKYQWDGEILKQTIEPKKKKGTPTPNAVSSTEQSISAISLPRLLLAFGLCMAGAALALSPTFLARAASADGQLEPFTVWEIQAWRATIALSSLTLFCIVAAWKLGKNRTFARRVQDDYRTWKDPATRAYTERRRWLRFSAAGCWFLVLFAIVVVLLSFDAYESRWFALLALESGVVETLQAIGLFAAGALLIRQSWRDHVTSGNSARLVGVCFGGLLIVGAGEEISWGQHWLGFGTPEGLARLNVQGEFNLHNIGSYWINNLQAAFFLVYLGIWPALGYCYPELHYVLDRLSMPIAPRHMILPALVGTLMDEHDIIARFWHSPPWRLSEGRELVFAGTILLAVIGMRHYRRRTDE